MLTHMWWWGQARQQGLGPNSHTRVAEGPLLLGPSATTTNHTTVMVESHHQHMAVLADDGHCHVGVQLEGLALGECSGIHQ